MDIAPDPSHDNPQPMSSPAQDMRRLKANTGATADELRAFLSELKGRSPKEMLGAIASASLFKSLIQATILVGVLIAAFTVIPFALNKMTGAGENDTESVETAAIESVEKATPEVADSSNPEQVDSAAEASDPSDVADPLDHADATAAEALGIGETKVVPLDVNPLDSSDDDLLKGLE